MVRMAGPAESTWEYAQLQDILRPGGRTQAKIIRPNSYGEMQPTDCVVDVFIMMLPSGQTLSNGATVRIDWHGPTGKWWVANWKCGT